MIYLLKIIDETSRWVEVLPMAEANMTNCTLLCHAQSVLKNSATCANWRQTHSRVNYGRCDEMKLVLKLANYIHSEMEIVVTNNIGKWS